MDDFCLYFLWFFSVFRRTVGQSEIFLSLKPSAFQGESPLKIWAHQGSRRLGGVRGQTHSILIALEDILQRHIFQKLKPTTDYLHFFLCCIQLSNILYKEQKAIIQIYFFSNYFVIFSFQYYNEGKAIIKIYFYTFNYFLNYQGKAAYFLKIQYRFQNNVWILTCRLVGLELPILRFSNEPFTI